MPAFAHWCGLKPWEVCGGPHELTLSEIDEFQRWIKRQHDAMNKAGR